MTVYLKRWVGVLHENIHHSTLDSVIFTSLLLTGSSTIITIFLKIFIWKLQSKEEMRERMRGGGWGEGGREVESMCALPSTGSFPEWLWWG